MLSLILGLSLIGQQQPIPDQLRATVPQPLPPGSPVTYPWFRGGQVSAPSRTQAAPAASREVASKVGTVDVSVNPHGPDGKTVITITVYLATPPQAGNGDDGDDLGDIQTFSQVVPVPGRPSPGVRK